MDLLTIITEITVIDDVDASKFYLNGNAKQEMYNNAMSSPTKAETSPGKHGALGESWPVKITAVGPFIVTSRDTSTSPNKTEQDVKQIRVK